MSDPVAKQPRLETCRWSLGLGLGLLLLSVAGAGLFIARASSGPKIRIGPALREEAEARGGSPSQAPGSSSVLISSP